MADDVFIDESEGDGGGEDIEILKEQQYLPLEKAKSPACEHFRFKAKDGQFVEKDKKKRKKSNGVLHTLQESFILQRKHNEHDGSFAKPPQNRVRR